VTIGQLAYRATHSPFGLALLLGLIASIVQTTVPNLPGLASVALYAVGVLGLAVGGGGIGLGQGRSDADERAKIAEAEVASLRSARDLIRALVVRPFERTIGRYQELLVARDKLAANYGALGGLVTPSGKVEWTQVDKTLALVLTDVEREIRDLDRGIIEEWRDVLPERVAELQEVGSVRPSESPE
jgi:hypothetical protein